MELYNRTICVTYRELTHGSDPVIRPCTLHQNVRRGNIHVARRGGGNNPGTAHALYIYPTLPQRYKERYVQRYGEPETILQQATLRQQCPEDTRARAFYTSFEYTSKGVQTHLSQKLIDEYTANASVIAALITYRQRLIATRHALGTRRTADIADIILRQAETYRTVLPHTLPASAQNLLRHMRTFEKKGYPSLISGKIGNTNTTKITPEAAQRLIALKRSRTPVLNNTQILARFNQEAAQKGWKTIRRSTLNNFYNQPENLPLWYDAVYGELNAHQHFTRRHQTILPTLRDTLWYGDGTRLNLYYRDEQGKIRTTSVYEVIDAATETLLGYHISDTEDYQAQYHAYRMAIQTAQHRPLEIVHDNQGGHRRANSAGMLDRITRLHRTAAPYNPTSKTIEAIFGRFQQQVLHKDWRFTGQNITAHGPAARPNLEFLHANADKLYTLQQLHEAYDKARCEWNNLPHPATQQPRLQMYLQSHNPDTPAVTPADMVDMFWVQHPRPVTFTPSGIAFTVNGHQRRYEVMQAPGKPDHKWRASNTYRRFIIKYDPYDFTSIRLYTTAPDGTLRFQRTAEPYIVIHRAVFDQQPGEASFIRQQQKEAQQQRAQRIIAAREIEHREQLAPEQHGLTSPTPKALPDDLQRQIQRRTRRYTQQYPANPQHPPVECDATRSHRSTHQHPQNPPTIGQITKQISLTTWDQLPDPTKPTNPPVECDATHVASVKTTPTKPKINLRKTAGKL